MTDAVVNDLEAVACDRCGVHYRPRLTRWACPVCDADAPNSPKSAAIAFHDPDVRVVSIVIAATAINLILLAILTLVAFH